MEFIEELNKAREELGISYRQLQKDTGISRSYLSSILAGQFNLSVKYGVILCNYYGIDIELFLKYKQQMLLRDVERISKELNLPVQMGNVTSPEIKKVL